MIIFSLTNFFFYLLFFFIVITTIVTIPQFRFLNSSLHSGVLEKIRAFECGFNIINKNYQGFSVTFLKVAILFLLVDLEIALLIPLFSKRGLLLKMSGPLVSTLGLISFFLIFLLLVEKKRGGLNWKEAS